MIRFENVTKMFGDKRVLNGFTLHVERGETMCLVGTSGAGKSVTLKHMVRLLTATSGEVQVDGVCINDLFGKDLSEIRSKFGYLFQSAALLQWLSVGENIALPLRELTKLTDVEVEEAVRDVLRKVDLEEAIWKLPSDISGGMKKRAGLARAIVTKPEIILYDEPTSGLDPVTSRTIDDLIIHLRNELGVTSVVVTHDMISALKVGDRIAMLHRGEVVEISTPQEFLNSSHPEVRKFLDAQYISRNFLTERGNSL
jgi:phospholipid/cholesterol/gamma-HCH transport system ATP-binding protein